MMDQKGYQAATLRTTIAAQFATSQPDKEQLGNLVKLYVESDIQQAQNEQISSISMSFMREGCALLRSLIESIVHPIVALESQQNNLSNPFLQEDEDAKNVDADSKEPDSEDPFSTLATQQDAEANACSSANVENVGGGEQTHTSKANGPTPID